MAREYAHPEWMVERWVAQFGEERTRQICEFDQRIPATSLRLENEDTEQELASEGVRLAPGTLLASSRTLVDGDLTRTRAYAEGRVLIQDEASQLVAALVGTGSAPARLLRRSRRQDRRHGLAQSDGEDHCNGDP